MANNPLCIFSGMFGNEFEDQTRLGQHYLKQAFLNKIALMLEAWAVYIQHCCLIIYCWRC